MELREKIIKTVFRILFLVAGIHITAFTYTNPHDVWVSILGGCCLGVFVGLLAE